uniref:Replication protein A 70 kDa DNA-binding subunit-like n=1 Tax=Phallusia mammillata TaxID=59560 RepID=A0A6F9DRL6_9ASCI|nr:replication protein A 70 kDa DNA-binding subunit-like [Phallusia mammillata]
MTYQLSQGALSKIVNGQVPRNPILKCLDIYDFSAESGVNDLAIVLSDSVHCYKACMLPEHRYNLVREGRLQQHTLLRLTYYLTSLHKGSKIIICYDVEILVSAKEAGGRVGNPERLEGPDDYCVYQFITGNMEPTNLTTGAIKELVGGKQPYQPIFQCLATKNMLVPGDKKIRLVLSDGVHSFSAVLLASSLNILVDDGSLQRYTVFQVIHYHSAVREKKRILILLDIDILEYSYEAGGQIGEPVPLSVTNEGLPCTSKPENENINPSGKQKTSNKFALIEITGNHQKIYIMPPQTD